MISKYAKRLERIARTLLIGMAASGRSHSVLAIVVALMMITIGIEIYEDWTTDESKS